jgi:hypothetical protein
MRWNRRKPLPRSRRWFLGKAAIMPCAKS